MRLLRPTFAAACVALLSPAWTGAQIVSVPKPQATTDAQLPTSRVDAQSRPAAAAPWPPAPVVLPNATGCSLPLQGRGDTLNVGPGQRYAELTDVPWLSLKAGDVVNIHYRAEPYRTKIGIRSQGRPEAPIVVNGVTDAQCNRPVISGDNAVTARDARDRRFFNKQYSENLGVFLLYRASDDPYGWRPQHIQFKNLKITGAHQSRSYTAQDGSTGKYSSAAAAVYAVVTDDLLIENCEITGNGNGIFVNSKSGDEASHRITIRNNRIWDNGNEGSYYEHNLYVQAVRPLYEGNYIGQLIPGAVGSSLKDRSSGTVIRYNHISAAARAIDLVEIEGGVPQVLNDPVYPYAWVYGNLIVDDAKQKGRAFSAKLVHWGGDNDPRYFRRGGVLNFYNNTVLVRVDKLDAWYVGLFDMPSDDLKVSLRANVIAQVGSAELRLGQELGTVALDAVNWLSKGWVPGRTVKVVTNMPPIEGKDPGIGPDGHPQPGAPGRDRGALGTLSMPASAAAEALRVTHEFAPPARLVPRTATGSAPDLGAFEGH